jgi:peptidoglycan/xylan/chitin deacetylase (PgdA/CDA1 family)
MRLPILTYHSLDDTGSVVSVSPAMFRRHLARLRAAGYAALPLCEALAWLEQPACADQRIVALTFDDGYASVHQHALPLLASYGWRATVFPVSDYVGQGNAWRGQPLSIPPARLLSWDDLRTLASMGWEIGAHSRTHPDLTRLGDRALDDQVLGPKLALQDRLGEAVRAFAYPYGRYDARVQEHVQAVYAAACTTKMGIAGQTSDRCALERIDMWYFSRAGLDGLLAAPWMATYVALCRAGRYGRAGLRQAMRTLLSTEPA